MKKFNIFLVAVLGILTFSSCDDFLDKKPTNSADSGSAVEKLEDAQVMMNGIMTKICSSSYLGRNFFLYADAKGGDLTITSIGQGNDLYLYNHTVGSNTYSGFWTVGYNVILQINNLLANIEKMQAAGSSDNFDDMKGQALTLRAMIYFDLVRLYGQPYNEDKSAWGVPNILEPLDAMAQELRATVEQNYQTIIADLTAAESLISKSTKKGFVNYWANKALQTRVYLHMENWSAALTAAEDIINNGPYDLYAPNKWVDSWKSRWGSESIFELEMNSGENALSGTGSLGAYYAREAHFNSNMGSYMASTAFLELLGEDPDDVRWGVMDYDERSKSYNKDYTEDRYGCCYKYLGGLYDTDAKDFPGDDAAQPAYAVNIKVIRLSEVYLSAAEAAFRTGAKDKAAEYLQAIRDRAPGLEAATEATVTMEMIENERAKELYGEGHKFWDMIRWNKTIVFDDDFGPVYPTHRENTVDRTHPKTLLPIFQSEINANPEIAKQQNPGY
ncbi:MAG: RagB/SusD family nutrient uptake outer membrane protein [Bacteroidales bacterium]|nr:RagB/SusD family nutrient uptake outer membrane protein [Bacteroidales bacterium]